MLYCSLSGVKRLNLIGPMLTYGHLDKVRTRFNFPGRRRALGNRRRGAGASFLGDGLTGFGFLR